MKRMFGRNRIDPNEVSRRDVEFLMERYDFVVEQVGFQARAQELVERSHAAEMHSLKQRLDISDGRLAALDAWTQTIATARGLGSPASSIETTYEGFEDEDNEKDGGAEDYSMESMLNYIENSMIVPVESEEEPVA